MKRYLFILGLALLYVQLAQSKVKLPAMMGDHMVLQQNSNVNLWGWADGKKVKVTTSWNNRTYQAATDENGTWILKVETPAGGYTPYSITISDGTAVTLSDVLIGEVWVCSGQSNMEFPLMGFGPSQTVENSLEVLLNTKNDRNRIRFITVPRDKNNTQRKVDFEGAKWEVPTFESAMECSAVGYFFAKQLTESLDIPVGLVINSWGGSMIESWLDEKTLSSIEGISYSWAKNPKASVQQRLGYLYNTMLMPIVNYTARGFLWYQGESNICNYQYYAPMMSTLIQHWRSLWKTPDMPFYCVQIAPYQYDKAKETGGAFLREAQVEALKSVPNTGIVSTIDLGNKYCIHPAKKKEVGLRLATLALSQTYSIGSKYVSTGPMMTGVEYKGNKAIVSFNNAFHGLAPNFCELEGFEMAGADKKFYPARARVVGYTSTVEVSCDQVAEPVAVRYAFHDSVEGATLSNAFGLAAFPFRTDDWDDIR